MQITEREELKVLSSAKELLSGDEDLQFGSRERYARFDITGFMNGKIGLMLFWIK